MIKNITILFLLLFGVGNAWADESFKNAWLKYNLGGDDITKDIANDQDLGTGTKLELKAFYLDCHDNWGASKTCWNGGAIYYSTNGGSSFEEVINNAATWKPDGWTEADYQFRKENLGITIKATGSASGSYSIKVKSKVWGDHDTWIYGNGSSDRTWSYKILPPDVKSGTISISATNTDPSSGTGLSSGSPIILISGMASTLTITATQNHTDANSALWCKFGTESYSSTTTYNIASGTTTSNQTLALAVKYRNNDAALDGAETSTTIYYKWAAPTPTIIFNSATPSALVSGNDITLVGTRANSSNAISFQYSTNDGASWSDISPKTSSLSSNTLTVTWTVPEAHGATQTYKFRAKLAEATPKYSSASSAVTVYGKKTIHVRNTNDWSNFYVYRYNSNSDKEANWHGTTTGVSALAGQWKDVVMTSQWAYFIFNDNGSNQITGNETYTYSSSISDGGYYTIQKSTGTSLDFTSTSAPTAPTINASSEATIGSATLATFYYSVGAGRDKTTPGVAYKQSDSNIADPATIYSSGTRVDGPAIYEGNQSGTISNRTITAGKDWYYVAYARNGFGTTYGDIRKIRTTDITLNKKGGDSGSGNFVAVGGKTISNITAPSRTGYTFAGYWTSENDDSGTKYYNANGTANITNWPTNLGASLTLFAHWTPNKYDVTLKLNGGTGTADQIIEVTYDAAMPLVIKTAGTAISIPTKTGYTLLGYWDATSGGNQYYAYSGSPAVLSSFRTWNKTSNADLHARWQANNYTLTLYKNDGSSTSTEATATYDATISVTPPTRTGYTFTGYWTDASGGTKIIDTDGHFVNTVVSGYVASGRKWQRTSDTDLHAQWMVNTYTITLNHGTGGSGSGTATIDYDATGYKTWSHNITQTGYHINGWYDNGEKLKVLEDNGTFADENITGYITSGKWSKASDCTLQAWWDPNNYTVTLDVDEDHQGSIAGATTIHTVTFNTITTTIPNRPTAEQGYGLDGYYTDHNGAGTKLINSDGTFIASVEGYTDGNKKWIRDEGVTLYAYYKEARITNITFSPGNIVAPGATVSVTASIDPDPVGPVTICWRVLYGNDNPLDPQPTFTPTSGGTVSFTSPAASGTYKVEATLHKSDGCGGDEIHSLVAPFQVAGDHTVTVQYKCGDDFIQASTSVTGKPLEWTEVVAHDIFGYYFSSWTAGDGVTIEEAAPGRLAELQAADPTIVAVIKMKATYDGKLIANYSQRDYIYFKSTALGWNDVYVYFYNSSGYWDENNGAGATGAACIGKGQMSLVPGETDIYYWDYGASIAGGASAATKFVAFTWGDCTNHVNFNGKSSSYPTNGNNQGFSAGTPMFVPITQDENYRKNNNNTPYYDRGYWTKYTGGTGYSIDIFHANGTYDKSINFEEGESEGMPYTANVYLNGGSDLYFKVHRSSGIYYYSTTNVNMSNAATTKPLTYSSDGTNKTTITTNVAGEYLFTLTCSSDGKLNVAVKYPAKAGDYRLVYSDNTQTKPLTSDVIHQENSSKDTVSFFVRPGSTPVLKIQQATISAGVLSWTEYSTISSSVSGLGATGVYNICLAMNGSGDISVEKVEAYTGNFYIRTDGVNNKWDNYRASDHLMTYSEYSETHSDYTHYFMVYVDENTNVKFVVANDYSPNISDTLIQSTYRGGDASHVDGNGKILANANIRFMWNIRNNDVYRAYLAKAQSDGSNFLVLRGTDEDNLKDENGNALRNASNSGQAGYNHKAPDHCIQFIDDENWIYEATVQVVPSTYVKLYAFFHDANFYYKGTKDDTFDDSHAIKLVEGSGDAVKVRVIYDFKTDRLLSALIPDGNIDTPTPINADVMFIREHHEDINQLTFSNGGNLSSINTAYGIMRFNKWTLNNKDKDTHEPLSTPASIYERCLYWVSFPFDVKLNEVFGFGSYGKHWIIQYYDGAERAEKGYWAESGSFWKPVWDRSTYILHANQGYLLTLAVDEDLFTADNEEIWGPGSKSSQIELYFPSSGNLGTITNTTVNCTIPEHACTINRAATEGLPDTPENPHTSYNRTIFDSHWNVMSVPTYVNATPNGWGNTTWTQAIGPRFLYTWNPDDNTLTATSGTGFAYHAMHAYMVQYGGNVQWVTSGTGPASIVARDTYAEQPKEVEFRIEIHQNEKMVDQTFVIMSNDDEINANFQFGEDMSKDFNARNANIYTMTADNVASAGNTLPMSNQTTIVPVGVSIKNAGTYTISIPSGTYGIGVTLIDEQTGVRTSLSAMDYIVELDADDYTNRFFLEIAPIKTMPTDIENVPGDDVQSTKARKIMIDGILYIRKDGKIYDARGVRIQ